VLAPGNWEEPDGRFDVDRQLLEKALHFLLPSRVANPASLGYLAASAKFSGSSWTGAFATG
jgi:hypothetical protein